MRISKPALFTVALCFSAYFSMAQLGHEADSASSISKRYVRTVQSKLLKTDADVTKKSVAMLRAFSRSENNICERLKRVDPKLGTELFSGSENLIGAFKDKFSTPLSAISGKVNGSYFSYLDTVKTALRFIRQKQRSSSDEKDLDKVAAMTDQIEGRFSQAQEVSDYLSDRMEALNKLTNRFGKIAGLSRMQKQVYYYKQQVQEYKSVLSDQTKLERKVLETLNRLPAFQQFMKQFGILGSLFDVSTNPGQQNIAGLQSVNTVEQLIRKQVELMGPSGQAAATAGLQSAQDQLIGLKDKLLKTGSPTGELPNFKPNTQRTKSFLKRLQAGANMQSVKANYFFPTTTDIGLSLGYKLSDRSVLGIGVSYKVGLGKDFRHVQITHQGIGLRSFIDFKIKGNFYLSGGAEYNYRSQFKNFEVLKSFSVWQKSALLGVSKQFKTAKNLKEDVKLLYDILHNEQIPRTQAFVLRLGFSLSK